LISVPVLLGFFFSLLLEISPPATSMWDSLSAVSAFETAVHSPLERQDIQTLWTEYLFYQRSKALQSKQSMDELINRCLMSVSTHSSLPYSSSAVWQDYRFHNQVSRFLLGFFISLQWHAWRLKECSFSWSDISLQIISISLSCHPQSSWSSVFKTYLRLFPGSVSLALRYVSYNREL